MGLPGSPAFIEASTLKFKGASLKSATFRWYKTAPYLTQVVGTFTPAKTYFCPAMNYSVYGQGYNMSSSMGELHLVIGFSDNVATVAQAGSVGTSLIDKTDVKMDGFMNWYPFGWYLPVGRSVYILNSALGGITVYVPATGTMRTVDTHAGIIGNVNLYLLETFEQ